MLKSGAMSLSTKSSIRFVVSVVFAKNQDYRSFSALGISMTIAIRSRRSPARPSPELTPYPENYLLRSAEYLDTLANERPIGASITSFCTRAVS